MYNHNKNDNNAGFVHLHNHTGYSLLDGSIRIKELVAKAIELNMPALAITDHGNMHGIVDFYKECKSKGIKPIIGCEVYVAPRSRFQKEPNIDNQMYHLVLLAKNETGYKNLSKLVTLANLEGFYYKPRVDKEILAQHNEGLIALSACLGGEIPSLLLKNPDKVEGAIEFYKNTYGQNFFLELQDHGIPEQKQVTPQLIELGKKHNIPLVATNDTHYLSRSDAKTHDVLLCIQTSKTVADPNRMKFASDQFYLKSYEEMLELNFPEEALTNTLKIADMINLELDLDQMLIPPYELPFDYNSPEEYLKMLCEEGIKKRYPEITQEIQERLDYELRIINEMGYPNYFLIVWDFINYARKNNISVGPGRGSAAGSIVAYALKITDIEPLSNGLIFERFLNPERVSMPDIDIDFCYERREEVIEYVVKKYGSEHVAQIITFGTMAGRMAIRDVGRALDTLYYEVDKIAKLIPQNLKIKEAIKEVPELKEAYETHSELLDISMAVEGLPRHTSTHAAGIVMSSDPLVEHTPLKMSEGIVVTQYPMFNLEELGLLKMDFLGLRTLTMMDEAVRLIKESKNIDIDLSNLPFDDPKTYELLSSGDTFGIFQLESAGMRNVLRELKPEQFAEIVAVVALYRPGPMEQIPVYIENKKTGEIPYMHSDLEPILKETYGVIVYQEQIMEIASKMAGFSMGAADILRRGIGKKKKELIEEQKVIFTKGVEKQGHDKEVGEILFALIEKFAAYGFNKSHAAAYAYISYQTAYLKANYPQEFMAALLTGAQDEKKIIQYINNCKQKEIKVLPPDINKSTEKFTFSGPNIRYSLAAIKNVGEAATKSLLETRKKEGLFTSLHDFCNKVNLSTVNKKTIESLIKAGAFDSLGGTRAQYLNITEKAITRGNAVQKERNNPQESLFTLDNDVSDNLPDTPEFPYKLKLKLEKEVLGLYISSHPLNQYRNFTSIGVPIESLSEKNKATVVGMITTIKVIDTKKLQRMAFVDIEDFAGETTIVIFPHLYAKYEKQLAEDTTIIVCAEVQTKDDGTINLIAQEIFFLEHGKFLTINLKESDQNKTVQLKDMLFNVKGNTPVFLNLIERNRLIIVGQDLWINPTDELLADIGSLLGAKSYTLIA